MAKGCYNFARMFLFVLNFLFLLIGLALIGVSLYLFFEPSAAQITQGFRLEIGILLYVTIAIGALTVLISIFGCCGAYCQSPCQLTAYFICLLLIVLIEMSLAVFVFVTKDNSQLRQSLHTSIKSRIENATVPKDVSDSVVVLQKLLGCCGANSSRDYKNNATAVLVCGTGFINQGCVDKMMNLFSENAQWILIGSSGLALIEVLSLILAMYACCFLRNNPEYLAVSQA